jgi:hypothetical protein
VASFAGREQELDAVAERLRTGGRAVITQAITGLGGVGKSQLAARYVQQRTREYDIVVWVRAEDGGIADLARLAAELRLPITGLAPSDCVPVVLEWLSTSDRDWLLVLDNIASPEHLDRLRPHRGHGHVLVTSRDRSLRQFGPELALDVFDVDTATAYLIARADRAEDAEAARALARALGCLPLALTHAAAYCQSGTSFTAYLRLLRELPAPELFDSNPELSYAQTVASTWKTSIEAAQTATPLAATVLEVAAHLAPDAIPRFLFTGLVAADCARGQKRLADALNAVARFCLATVTDSTVSVHRLLQKVVRDNVVARGDDSSRRRALEILQEAFPEEVDVVARWSRCEELLPHVVALADTWSPPDADASLIGLLNRASGYLNCAEPGQRGLGAADLALRHAERLIDDEHPAALDARDQHAFATREAGHLADAITLYEPLLADSKRILGADATQTLRIGRHLALFVSPGWSHRRGDSDL